MIPVKQKRVYEENVTNGDCWRSCIESILEITSDSTLPYWEMGEEFEDHYDKMMLAINELGFAYHEVLVKDLQINELLSPDTYGYCLAIGLSPRGTETNPMRHSVVWKNGIAFDPHPSNEGILNVDTFGIFNKILKEA